MKIGFEAMLLSFFSMFFLAIGLYFMDILFTHQSALQLQEYAVMMIEHHDRYDSMVAEAIEQRAKDNDLAVSVSEVGDTYGVEVTYSISLPLLERRLSNTLYTICASR